jgi:hypothetical protein
MTTLTVNIDNKKSEKAVKAVLEALGLSYNVDSSKGAKRPLNKAEQKMYDRLKRSFEQIKLYEEGKIELPDARDLINELQG